MEYVAELQWEIFMKDFDTIYSEIGRESWFVAVTLVRLPASARSNTSDGGENGLSGFLIICDCPLGTF